MKILKKFFKKDPHIKNYSEYKDEIKFFLKTLKEENIIYIFENVKKFYVRN